MIGGRLPERFIIFVLLSFPVFMNLYLGQVNIWLMVCVGEIIRLIMSGKTFRAGIWLGGLLLKPQLLIIIIPIIVLKRWKSTIAGFFFSSFLIIATSFALAKTDGFYSLFTILFGYSKGITISATNIMMNWRMIGFNLSDLFNPLIGWSIAYIGSIITVFAIIYIWKKIVNADPEIFVIGILATFAATGALTWHSHLSMSLVLIPPIVYLNAKKSCLII